MEGEARAVISGGPAGVETTMRIWARRGVMLSVTPAEAMVYVNDLPIGQASQFDTLDEIYEFATPGSYTIKSSARTTSRSRTWSRPADDAKQDVATIAAKLAVGNVFAKRRPSSAFAPSPLTRGEGYAA